MASVKQLKTFVTVVEQKSFTKAARVLFMTQPAVSAQIKALEEDLGVQLIERLEKGIALTEAGKILYHEARRFLEHYERAINLIEETRNLKTGHLTIGASTIPGEYILPRFLGRFHNLYPGIKIHLLIADTGMIHKELLERRVEIAFMGAKLDDRRLEFAEFTDDELIFVCAPHHPLAGRQEVKLEEIAAEKFILRESTSGTRLVLEKYLAERGLELEKEQIVMEVGSTRAVITAVEEGLGISIVSRWAVQDSLKLGKLKELKLAEGRIIRPLYMARWRRQYLSRAARAFWEMLTE